MTNYIVESSHTPQECLKALDEILANSPQLLSKFEWGCNTGDHTGWANIQANNKTDIKSQIPSFIEKRTRIVEVGKFTPEQIKSFHSMK